MNEESITLADRICRNKEILFSEIDNETILLSLEKNRYYGMESTAHRIWEMLSEPTSGNEIVTTLLLQYSVSYQQCQKETAEFLQELYSAGLIQRL